MNCVETNRENIRLQERTRAFRESPLYQPQITPESNFPRIKKHTLYSDAWKPIIVERQINGRTLVQIPKSYGDKPKSRQDSFVDGQVIYVDPTYLRQNLQLATGTQQQDTPESYNSFKDNQIESLKALIGKNRDVQIQGLKSFLENAPQNFQTSTTALKNPQGFKLQKTDNIHTQLPSVVNTDAPVNISALANSPAAVSQKTLHNLQQKLDEASQRQASEALEKAQEQALAHVEAQHKAIAEAQKAIFEKFQNSVYHNPQALPLIQQSYPTQVIPTEQNYISLPQNEPHNSVQNNNRVLQFPTITNYANIGVKEKNNYVPKENLIPQAEKLQWNRSEIYTAPVIQAPYKQFNSKEANGVPVESFKSKINPLKTAIKLENTIFYAPNHIHESAAQHQAKITLMNQVKSINKEILKSQKISTTNYEHESTKFSKNYEHEKSKHISKKEKSSDKREQAEATTYQEILLRPNENQNSLENEKQNSLENDYEDENVSRTGYVFL